MQQHSPSKGSAGIFILVLDYVRTRCGWEVYDQRKVQEYIDCWLRKIDITACCTFVE